MRQPEVELNRYATVVASAHLLDQAAWAEPAWWPFLFRNGVSPYDARPVEVKVYSRGADADSSDSDEEVVATRHLEESEAYKKAKDAWRQHVRARLNAYLEDLMKAAAWAPARMVDWCLDVGEQRSFYGDTV